MLYVLVYKVRIKSRSHFDWQAFNSLNPLLVQEVENAQGVQKKARKNAFVHDVLDKEWELWINVPWINLQVIVVTKTSRAQYETWAFVICSKDKFSFRD